MHSKFLALAFGSVLTIYSPFSISKRQLTENEKEVSALKSQVVDQEKYNHRSQRGQYKVANPFLLQVPFEDFEGERRGVQSTTEGTRRADQVIIWILYFLQSNSTNGNASLQVIGGAAEDQECPEQVGIIYGLL